jgi:quercetin dioxygenase-like cupin family protein
MIRAGFTFENPLTQSGWVVIESDAETNGMGWTLEIRCAPKARPDILEHLHLTWTETFEIISGVAHYKLDGLQKTANAGETIVMPPRQPHIHPWNAGDTELVYRQVTKFERPNPQAVQDVIGVFATLFGLARERKVSKSGLPKNPLQFAATARTLARYDGYDPRFPIPMQKVLAATLGRLAEALGYKGVYPQHV